MDTSFDWKEITNPSYQYSYRNPLMICPQSSIDSKSEGKDLHMEEKLSRSPLPCTEKYTYCSSEKKHDAYVRMCLTDIPASSSKRDDLRAGQLDDTTCQNLAWEGEENFVTDHRRTSRGEVIRRRTSPSKKWVVGVTVGQIVILYRIEGHLRW